MRRRHSVIGVAVAVLVVIGVLPATTAAFTAAETVSGNTATTATLTATTVTPGTPQPAPSSMNVAWTPANVAGSTLAPQYTLERSTTPDGTTPTTVYTGADTSITDPGNLPAGTFSVPLAQVSAGSNHTLALDVNGHVLAWGGNGLGQLGTTSGGGGTPVQLPESAFGNQKVTAVSAGADHSAAITADGTAWTWGNNDRGQLGTLNTTSLSTPYLIPPGRFRDKKIISISAGYSYTVAVTEDGDVYAWGDQTAGKLGNGLTMGTGYATAPTLVFAGDLGKIISVAAGSDNNASHTAAIAKDGSVWMWGNNSKGQLGFGVSGSSIERPLGLPLQYFFGGSKVTSIAVGGTHTAATTEDGSLWAWGSGGASSGNHYPTKVDLESLGGRGVASVSAGNTHTVARADDGTVWAWGAIDKHDLGVNGSPTQIGAGTIGTATAVDAGHSTIMVTTKTGTWALGSNLSGELGTGNTTPTTTPTPVKLPKMSGCPAGAPIAADGSCGLAADTTYYYRVSYTLGKWQAPASPWVALTTGLAPLTPTIDTTTTTPTTLGVTWPTPKAPGTFTLERSLTAEGANPTTVYTGTTPRTTDPGNLPPELVNVTFTTIAAGLNHTAAVATDGSVYTWGDNSTGQLGNGTTTVAAAPVHLPVRVFGGKKVTAIAASGEEQPDGTSPAYTVAVAEDGSVWAWGYNGSGQLGTGDKNNRSVPVQVGADKFPSNGITTIAAGAKHTVAVAGDGSVWAWGDNQLRQLGTASRDSSLIPVRVGADKFPVKGIANIAAGPYHTVVVAKDGSVWAWGLNFFGQLGAGSHTSAIVTPVQVGADKLPRGGMATIATGERLTLAVAKDDGSVWAWGNNNNVPERVGADKFPQGGIVAIAVGFIHTVAVAKDGSVWAWGNNSYGQLGTNDPAERSVPVQVGADKFPRDGIATVAASMYSTVAVAKDGSVWAWGNNTHGQLGISDTASVRAPASVGVKVEACSGGAVSLPGGGCSLRPGAEYFYRLSYTVGDRVGPASGWMSLRTPAMS